MRKIFLIAILPFLPLMLSAQNALLTGKVLTDFNFDCQSTGNEAHLNDIVIEARDSQSGATYYAVTSYLSGGIYTLNLPQGTYIIKATLPYDLPYYSFCNNSIVRFLQAGSSDTLNFEVQPLSFCSKLLAEISSPGLIDCGRSEYRVRLENIGTIGTQGLQLELQLDPQMQLDTADYMFTSLGNGRYFFALSDIGIGRDSALIFGFDVSYCATVPGQTFCAKLTATAFNECSDSWQGPLLEIDAQSAGDSVIFTARNVGPVNMLQPPRTRVIIDDVMYSPPVGPIDTLNPVSFTVFADEGKMIRLEMKQDSTMPKIIGGPWAWAALEGANPDGQGRFNVGNFTAYYADNTNPSISHDCRETSPVLLFNSKTVQTEGYGVGRAIEKGIPFEYQIKFQNTTPTVAQSVEIIDTIPAFLDLNSLIIGASSHPGFNLSISAGRVLRIHYPFILLQNPSIDSAASYGSISFYLDALDNLPLGTVVENSATIVLNYIDTVSTETAFNTIAQNFIQVLSMYNEPGKTALKIYPNPSSGIINLELERSDFSDLRFELYDLQGRMISVQNVIANPAQIVLPEISSGIYLYKVYADEQLIDIGRLIRR